MNRFSLIAGLAYGLILVGLGTLNGGLLALAIPLVLYLAFGLFYAPSKPDLRILRTIDPERVAANTPVTVRLSITNLGTRLEEILLEDWIPSGLKLLEGEPRLLTDLAPQATVELAYTVRGNRGIHKFPGVRTTVYDRLGLFQRQALQPAPGQVFVLPEIPRLRRVAIRPRRTRVYSGNIPARLGGPGVEFFGVRDYLPGDSLGHINWRISARHAEALYSNEFEQERVADVWLILDARRRSDVKIPGDSLFEHAVTAAAALAQVFLSEGNRVGLLVYGGFLDWTYPGYGKIQRERVLRALARARPGESLIFDKLENLPTRVFPPHSQLILISPLHDEDLEIVVHLRARGYHVIGISPDPISFEAGALASERAGQLGMRLARVERKLLLARLRQAGVQVFDWDVGIPFDRAAHLALSRPLPWFHALGVRP